jgi:glycerophosphoryl diester phosphodiesterase
VNIDTTQETAMPSKLYGHRGARAERPENTIEGFRHAKSLGLKGIETDIAMTRDFVPVLHHDATLSDGRLIKSLNYNELPKHIPSLEEALHAVPEIDWLLEIKTYPPTPDHTHAPAVMVQHILPILAAIDPARLRILAFDWSVLREIAQQAPALRRICLTTPDTAAARDLWWGPGFGALSIAQAVAASGAAGWAAFHAALSEEQALAACAAGLEVFAWTVNELADFHRLRPLIGGRIGIITDNPSTFLQDDEATAHPPEAMQLPRT